MTRLHRAIAAALLGLFLGLVPASVSAQTLTTTYLTAAATATGTTYTVNSGTGIVPGFWIYVDKEAALVTNVSGTTITVQRGSAGMTTAHAVGAAAYIGPIQFFYRANPSSASCAGGTPNIWINVDGGQSFVCSSGLWRNLALMGPGPDGAILVGTGATTPATFTTTIPGTITFDRVLVGDGTAAAPSYSFTSDTDTGSYLVSPNTLGFASAGALQAQVENGAFRLQASTFFAIGNDVILARDAANTLALRNGTATQEMRVGPSGAYLSILKGTADASIKTIGATSIAFGTSSIDRWFISSSGHWLSPSDNTYDIGASGSNRPRTLYVGTSVVSPSIQSDGSPATAGFIRMKNGASIYGRNAADSANLQMLDVTAGNRVRIAGGGDDIQWGTVLIAMGGGATPTLGTIGGSGPATAAQNSWMRVIDSTGAAFWVPVWK